MELELSGALSGLRRLTLADRDAYRAAIDRTQRLCWQQFFPFLYFFYGIDGDEELLLEEIDGSLCTYALSKQDGKPTLGVYFLPMPMNAIALRRCLERVCEFNGRARVSIKFLEEEDASALDGFGAVARREREREYLYAPERYGDLSGRPCRNLRRNLDKIATRGDVEVLPYDPADAPACAALLDGWAALQKDKYGAVRYRRYTENCLRQAGRFAPRDLFGRVVRVDGKPCAFGFAGEIRPGLGSLFIGYADLEFAGLNQFLNVELLRGMEDCALVNSAIADTPGLRFAKEALLPVRTHGMLSARVDTARIHAVAVPKTPGRWPGRISEYVQAGPGIAGFRPCLRVLLGPEARPAAAIGQPALDRARRLLVDVAAAQLPERIAAESPLAALYGETALLLQKANHYPVGWGSARKLADGCWEVAFEIAFEHTTAAVLECTEALIGSALDGDDRFLRVYRRNDLKAHMWELFVLDRRRCAVRLGVPFAVGYRHNCPRLGQGRYAELTAPGYTGGTASLPKVTAGDKSHTYHELLMCGLPVARQRLAGSLDEALAAADEIGYPVVVKPRDSHRGKGVSVDLRDAAAVRTAYLHTSGDHRRVLVERCLPGDDYRLLVVGGRCAGVVRRPPPAVTGDGRHSVAELVELANVAERRDGLFLDPIRIDATVEAVLAAQGLAVDAVPDTGRCVAIRRAASPESSMIDVTGEAHPDNIAAAEAAAAAIGLDIAGIDFISPDIAVSWRDNGGGIVEVNAGPGVDLHIYPTVGKSRDVSWHMIRTRFPATAPGAVPITLVAGRYGKRQALRRIGNLLALLGEQVGACIEQRSFVGGRETGGGNVAALLADTAADSLVFELSGRDMAFGALPVERVAVAVLTDAGCSGYLVKEARDPQLASRLHRLAVDAANEAVVIDATVEALRSAVAVRPPAQVGYVWAAPDDPEMAVAAHLTGGGWAIVLDREPAGVTWITWRDGAGNHCRIVPWEASAVADGDALEARRQLMFACAVAIAHGYAPAALAAPVRVVMAGDDGFSTLVARREPDGPAWAHADYRDAAALARLRNYHAAGPRGACLRVVLAAEPGAVDHAATLAAALGGNDTLWCCAGPGSDALAAALRAQGIGSHSVEHCHGLERGFASARMDANARDTVVVLAAADTVRRRLLRIGDPWIAADDSGSWRWSPGTLERLFAGRWVSGPRLRWGADCVRWIGEQPVAGSVVVVPGDATDHATHDTIERRIYEAFARGAAAVVAPLLPADLPRWRAVLVCDDPALGMRRLTQHARARLRGPLVACAADLPPLMLMRVRATLDALAPAHVQVTGAGAGVPTLMQALAATPVEASLTLFEMPGRGGALSIVRPDLWIGTAHGSSAEDLRAALAALPPDCTAVLVAPADALGALLDAQAAREAPLVILDPESGAVSHQWPATGSTVGEAVEHCLVRLLRPLLPGDSAA